MMMAWSRKMTWIGGLAILVATNIIALGGVAYNRAGDPDATLRLTERELKPPYWTGFNRENGGLSLLIEWRTPAATPNADYGYNRRASVDWLNEAKLDELGFDVKRIAATAKDHTRSDRVRDAWLVLEYDGPAYQAALERARTAAQAKQALASGAQDDATLKRGAAGAKRLWDWERQAASRLFIVAAGPDVAQLRKRYPNRARYGIARGHVQASVTGNADGKWHVQGSIQGLAVASVYVPRVFRDGLEAAIKEGGHSNADPPRFVATLAYGRRQEPWLVSVGKTQP